MQRWLLDRDIPIKAIELDARPAEELLCTEKGQVLLLPDEKSVFDLNADHESELAVARDKLRESLTPEQLRNLIGGKIGVSSDAWTLDPKSKLIGKVSRDKYDIEKHVLIAGSGVPLPTLVFRPEGNPHDVCLYLHENGKSAAAGVGGAIEKLTMTGKLVVAVDLSGQGETGANEPSDSQRSKLLGDWKTYSLGYLLQRSLLGQRVKDALVAARFAATLTKGRQGKIELIGVGQTGLVALHSAALVPERFGNVTLRETPRDWASVVRRPTPEGFLPHVVHGALELYDLKDLVQLAGPEKVHYQD